MEGAPQRAELAQFHLDLGQMLDDYGPDVVARRITAGRDRDYLADVGEREPKALRFLDEGKLLDGIAAELAIAIRVTLRRCAARCPSRSSPSERERWSRPP